LGEFADRADRIVGPQDETLYDPDNGVAAKTDTLSAGKAYKVNATFAALKAFKGHLYGSGKTSLALKSGWNWIAYPHYESKPVATVLTNASEGDCIAAQSGYAEYADGGWEGSLSVLNPGEGYLYKSKADKTLGFDLQAAGTHEDAAANETTDVDIDIRKYPNTMNVTARLHENGQDISGDSYVIYAMEGNELRGFGQYIGSNYYITVYGDEAVDITFVAENATTKETNIANETLPFASDLVGSRKSPFSLSIGVPTGIGAVDADAHKLRIYSVAGVLINADGNMETLRSLAPGVYLVNGRKYIVK